MLGRSRSDLLYRSGVSGFAVCRSPLPRQLRVPLLASCSLQQEGIGAPASGQRYYKKGLLVPSQLLSAQAEGRQQTVFTIRFCTSYARGSDLDSHGAGVQLCLVGADGSAVLHRVSPVFDPHALSSELEAIKRVVDNSVGANHFAISQASSRLESLPEGKKRFQAGSVDEISFLGPEIGPIQSILVCPEESSWRLEEVTVSSSRSRHTDRFVCGDMLGVKGGVGFLIAVPPNAVVYGSGESVVILTQAQARVLHDAGMGKYSLLKERLIQTNLSLVGIGTSLAWAFAGEDFAVNFAYGGIGGLLYQWLLQKGIDGMSLGTSVHKRARGYVPGDLVAKVLGSGGFRVAMVGFFVSCAIYGSRLQDPTIAMHSHTNQVQAIMMGVAGFLMYKLALIGVLTVPPLLQWDEAQEN